MVTTISHCHIAHIIVLIVIIIMFIFSHTTMHDTDVYVHNILIMLERIIIEELSYTNLLCVGCG